MTRYGMVINLSRCTGCRACMIACKVENNTPKGNYWMYTFRLESGEFPNTEVWFLPRPCMHCENPACVTACPVDDARFIREDGIVATNAEACIGCRYCDAACPYGVNYFNYENPQENYYLDWDDPDVNAVTGGVIPPYDNPSLDEPIDPEGRVIAGGGKQAGVMEKCTFCVHRVTKGMQPACAEVCPTSAITFGDLDDPESEVSKLLAENEAFRLQEEFGTSPKVFYIGGKKPDASFRQVEKVGGEA